MAIIEDVDDGVSVGLVFRNVTVLREGKMPAFDQDVARSEALNRPGNVDDIVQRGDVGSLDPGVLEQQPGFGDVGRQDGGQGEEVRSEVMDGVVGEQLGSACCDHDGVHDGDGFTMLLQSFRHGINSARRS